MLKYFYFGYYDCFVIFNVFIGYKCFDCKNSKFYVYLVILIELRLMFFFWKFFVCLFVDWFLFGCFCLEGWRYDVRMLDMFGFYVDLI